VITALLVRQGRYENLLLVFPKNLYAPKFDTQKIEQLCEDELLITYEIPGSETAKTLTAEAAVTLVGTNSYYPHLMGYTNIEGSFFSKAAWDGKQKHIVLNKAAAFALFGSYHITGKTVQLREAPWLVSGVLDDGDDENSIIYVPSSVNGGSPESLAVLLAPGMGIDESYTKGVLKTLGAGETNYRIVNADILSVICRERIFVAVKVLFCLLFFRVCPPVLSKVKRRFMEYRALLRRRNLKDIIMENRSAITGQTGMVLLLAAAAVILLDLLRGILLTCLGWRDALGLPVSNDFEIKTALLKNYGQWNLVLFWAFLILAAIAVCASAWDYARPKKETTHDHQNNDH
jgi:hypothetical protein